MKKLIIVLLIIVFMGIPVFADEVVIPPEYDGDEFIDHRKYIPEEVLDMLEKNGIDPNENGTVSTIAEHILKYLKNGVDKYYSDVINLFGLLIFITIFKRINDNSSVLMSFGNIVLLMITGELLRVLARLISDSGVYLGSIKELLSLLLPGFVTVDLIGGGKLTSITSASSFAAVISLIELFMSGVIGFLAAIIIVTSVFEKLSAQLNGMKISASVKKYTIALIGFVTTLMLTVLSLQNFISARADSVSTRSIKFVASSFVPIIGNAVGEALRTVSSGVAYLKSSVGASSAFAVFFTTFPFIAEVVAVKLLLSFVSLFAMAIGCENECYIIDSFKGVVDIILSIIICCCILSFILVYLFSVTLVSSIW